MSRGTREAALRDLGVEIRGWQAEQELFDATVAELAGLNRTDWRCLDMLFTRGPMTAGDLAAAVRLTTGAVTGVLDHLEAAGLVRRVRDAADRRRVNIELTAKVGEQGALVYGPLIADSAEMLAAYSDEQLDVIVDFVRRERELLARHTARLRETLDARERIG